MDFAVTSPLRQGVIADTAREQLAAASAYEDHKASDRSTEERCRQQGIRLVPVVAESYGGWGTCAQRHFKWLLHAHASLTGKSVSQASLEFYSSLSIIIMRANVRSLLARVSCQ